MTSPWKMIEKALELDRSLAEHVRSKLAARTCTGCGILLDAGLAPAGKDDEGNDIVCLCDECEQRQHQAVQQAETDTEKARDHLRAWKRHPVGMKETK